MNITIDSAIINRTEKHLRTNDGIIFEFAQMLDHNLAVTSDANEACIVIYRADDNLWNGIDTRILRDETGAPAERTYSKRELLYDAFNRRSRHFRLQSGDVIPFVATLDKQLNPTKLANYDVAIVRLPFDCLYRVVDVRLYDSFPDFLETTH